MPAPPAPTPNLRDPPTLTAEFQATSPQTGRGSRNAFRILTGDVDDLTALTADMKNVSVVPSDDPDCPRARPHGLTGGSHNGPFGPKIAGRTRALNCSSVIHRSAPPEQA